MSNIKKNIGTNNLKRNTFNQSNNKGKNTFNNNQIISTNKNIKSSNIKINGNKINNNSNKNNKKTNNTISDQKLKHLKKINSVRSGNHHYNKKLENYKKINLNINTKNKNKDDFDIEYEKLNNLCNYKKNVRGNSEVEDYMKRQKKLFKENKLKQQQLQFQNYDKIYKNFVNLEKSIKLKNIHKINKKKKEINNDNEEIDNENEKDKSNGSIENNNLKKNYYFGCLDVKWILANNSNIPTKK